MKNLFITLFCCWSTVAFAQNGFFLQPEIGAGMTNANWKPTSSVASYPGQSPIFSWQGQLDLGYKAGKWRFITGLGYLRTGVNLKQGDLSYFYNYVFVQEINPLYTAFSHGITDYNPHYIVPVKIGYEVRRFSNRLSLTPLIGAELTRNLPRTFLIGEKTKQHETPEDFINAGNKNGITALLQLNFEYKVNSHYDLTFGPSVHYMYTSELNFKDEHDYAFLMNLGLKWNFKKRTQNTWGKG
jgi:hypothetical protein